MRNEPADEPRVVVDESTFDFRGLSATTIEIGLDELNEAILEFRRQAFVVASAPMWDAAEVLDGCELIDFLSRAYPSEVSRDTLVLANSLLANCPEWSDALGEVSPECSIDGADPVLALSVGYAVAQYSHGRAVACLTFRNSSHEGRRSVISGLYDGEAFFVASAAALKLFWRWRMRLEDVDEAEFFASCEIAFPLLLMHDELSFRKFEGSYLELRYAVISALSVLNDHFKAAYRAGRGVSNDVQAFLGQYKFDVSMESVKTRSSDKLMRFRDVDFGDTTYRCEWHVKLERHRNRIHFWIGEYEGRFTVLIGLFVQHLPT